MTVSLRNPCQTTSVVDSDIDEQVFYAWMYDGEDEMILSIDYTDFICEVSKVSGIDCGEFNYVF